MTDSDIAISTSLGKLNIGYSVHTNLTTVRFDYQGKEAPDNYAMLFQNGNHIGTRNGTPIFLDRQTEEGELHYVTALTKVQNVLSEHYSHHPVDADVAKILEDGAGIELPQALSEVQSKASWRDRQAKRQEIFDYLARRVA